MKYRNTNHKKLTNALFTPQHSHHYLIVNGEIAHEKTVDLIAISTMDNQCHFSISLLFPLSGIEQLEACVLIFSEDIISVSFGITQP